MNNLSLYGEDLRLKSGFTYYIIDALYLSNLKSKIDHLNKDNLDKEIEDKVFPYAKAPFAKLKLTKDLFRVGDINKSTSKHVTSNNRTCFSTDTGLILFIEESVFINVARIFDYDDLVDSMIELINSTYWDDLMSGFSNGEIGLVIAPGIDSGYEFEGSGEYRIVAY